MLREMRKTDRDRDGVLRPDQIESFLEKFNIPLQGILDHLQRRFADEKFEGMTNYELLVKYFNNIKDKDPGSKNPPHAAVAEESSTENSRRNKVSKLTCELIDLEKKNPTCPSFLWTFFKDFFYPPVSL